MIGAKDTIEMERFAKLLEEHRVLFSEIENISPETKAAGEIIVNSLRHGNKILICGNGGSASDAQHFAAEVVGRFEKERNALPAISLATDTSILTAIGNDYGYDEIFSRQVEGLGMRDDVLVGISTSGNSKNVIHAVKTAKRKLIHTIGLLGRDGGELAKIADTAVVVPHDVTARIQEVHIFIIHFLAACIEHQLFPEK